MKRKKTIRAGRLVKTIIYTAPCISDTQPHVRDQKRKASTEAQRRMNDKYRWEKLEMLLAANFGEDDVFCTLTYRDEDLPFCRKLAVDRLRRCVRAMRERKGGKHVTLDYIYVTENKHSDGRYHHHVVIHRDDLDLLLQLWKWGHVNVKTVDAYGYEGLAKYLCKETVEGQRPGSRAWSQSKGLRKPTVEVEICKDDADIVVPAGCFVLASESNQYEYGSWRYIKYQIPRHIPYRYTRPRRRRKAE